MKNRKFIESLNNAANGFLYVLKSQKNMRIHFLLGILVIMLGIYLNLRKMELLFICGAVSLVLVAEMINTSIELTIDLVKGAFDPLAKIVKDISAGAVFVASVNAVIVGYVVFSGNLTIRLDEGIYRIGQSPWHITFLALIFVLFLVVAGKALSKRGTPFRGGMPSGHAAFAFSIWTIISFISKEGIIIFLVFAMAVLIARHRIITNVHSLWEVVAGAFLGALATALIIQLLV